MIRPTIGVFTNIGDAHSEGFTSPEAKEKEKRILFREATEVPALQVQSVSVPPNQVVLKQRIRHNPHKPSVLRFLL